MSVDPIIDTNDPQQFNAYAYSRNNPVTFADPSGLWIPIGNSGPWVDSGGCRDGDCWDRPHSSGRGGGGGYGGGGQRAQDKLNEPARNKYGNRASGRDIDTLRELGYRGSEQFTYADAIEFANQDEIGRAMVCHFLSGTPDQCFQADVTLGDIIRGIAEFAYELTPIADAVHCVSGEDSCLWLLTNVAPPLKGLKAVKAIDDVADGAKAAKNGARACSFTGDTRVLMADGTTKPISQVNVGDQVLATDPETGESGSQSVTAIWIHQDIVLDFSVAGGATVATTEDHRFWNLTDQEWQHADQLDPGDTLLTAIAGTLASSPVLGRHRPAQDRHCACQC